MIGAGARPESKNRLIGVARPGAWCLLVATTFAALGGLALGRLARSQPRPGCKPRQGRPTAELAADLLPRLAEAVGIDSNRLRLDLRAGVAVLRGEVDWPAERLRAERWLAARDDVLDVVNLLTLSGSAAAPAIA